MSNAPSVEKSVLWKQVWGLAILKSAVSFSWTVYYFAQPKILEQIGMKDLGGFLLITVGVLGLIIEPLVGVYADRVQRRVGTRFPVINMGVLLTSLIFLTVAFGLKITIPPGLVWVVPVLMVFWVASMKLFQTPALSLLWQFSTPKELPRANSILVLTMGLVAATGPFVTGLIEKMGFALTFALGGVILFVSATIMKRLSGPGKDSGPKGRDMSPSEKSAEWESVKVDGKTLLRIFLIGFCLQIVTAPIYYIDPATIHEKLLPGLEAKYITAAILVTSALVAIPIGKWVSNFGATKAMRLGMVVMTVLLGLLSLNYNPGSAISPAIAIGFMVMLGITACLIFNTSVPYALKNVPGPRAALGTGMLFGGAGAAFALISLISYILGSVPVYLIFFAGIVVTLAVFLILRGDSAKADS